MKLNDYIVVKTFKAGVEFRFSPFLWLKSNKRNLFCTKQITHNAVRNENTGTREY